LAANGAKVVQAGGAIVEILAGDTKANLDAWVNNFMLFTTTVRDPDAMPAQTLTALVRREYCYVVDLDTMKIVTVDIGTTDGSKPGGISSSLQEAMSEVLTRLGM
jgi:hypothetical protein